MAVIDFSYATSATTDLYQVAKYWLGEKGDFSCWKSPRPKMSLLAAKITGRSAQEERTSALRETERPHTTISIGKSGAK